MDYEIVNEIGRRAESGHSRMYGKSGQSWEGKTSRVSRVAEAIDADVRRESGATSVLRQPQK